MLLLLRYNASSSIINGTGQIPKDVTEDDEIITMLEGEIELDFLFPLPFLSRADPAVWLIISLFALHSCREERDTAAGGETASSGQRRGRLRSV